MAHNSLVVLDKQCIQWSSNPGPYDPNSTALNTEQSLISCILNISLARLQSEEARTAPHMAEEKFSGEGTRAEDQDIIFHGKLCQHGHSKTHSV